MYCSNCGKTLSKEAKFCTQCGTPVSGEAVQEQIIPPVISEPHGTISASASCNHGGAYSFNPEPLGTSSGYSASAAPVSVASDDDDGVILSYESLFLIAYGQSLMLRGVWGKWIAFLFFAGLVYSASIFDLGREWIGIWIGICSLSLVGAGAMSRQTGIGVCCLNTGLLQGFNKLPWFTIFPLICEVYVLGLSREATQILQGYGYEVGLLGVSGESLEYLACQHGSTAE